MVLACAFDSAPACVREEDDGDESTAMDVQRRGEAMDAGGYHTAATEIKHQVDAEVIQVNGGG